MNASQDTDDEALWFGRQIEAVFGTGSQSTFSRFLKAAADDHRLHKTILRSIHNAATGHHRVSIEMKVLLRLLQNPHRIQDLIGGLQEPCSPGNTSVVPVGRVGADACSSTQTAGEGTMHGACRFEHPCDDEPSSPGLWAKEVAERLRVVKSTFKQCSTNPKMAAACGSTASSVDNWLSKNNLPRVPEMIALCELTGLTLDWIYRGETGSIDPAVALKLPKRGDV